MPENFIERYLTDMGEVRGTRSNVPETSFYPALERLLTAIGKTLSPNVRCVINLANRGTGFEGKGGTAVFTTPVRVKSKANNENYPDRWSGFVMGVCDQLDQ